MYKVIGGRGTGKTSKLIEEAKKNNYTLVVKDVEKTVEHMYSLGITGVKIISFGEFFGQLNFNENYVVDDLEAFVRSTEFGQKLQGYGLNNEEK